MCNDKFFVPSMARTEKLDYSYKSEVNSEKRFLAIGFDDFRESDFSLIIPLFEKYGALATFNKFISSEDESDNQKLSSVLSKGHEVGDHTFMHSAFPYEDALFNGQNPSSPDGNQIPYPTNAQLREDVGNGRNAFYMLLTSTVNSVIANSPLNPSVTWGDLTDEQCQTLREYYSVLKNPALSTLLDTLSNKYLGTSGASVGSFNSDTGIYTGGIFTGCKTSANHEVWERILQLVQCYYKDKYDLNWNLQCWSWPGEYYFGKGFKTSELSYYDSEMTINYNMNARFESSLYTDETGSAKLRSFTDVLREFGYKYTHDYIYPGRVDGLSHTAMKAQFYMNEDLSKCDAVLYPTNRTVPYLSVANSYPNTFFTSGKTKGAQMYDADGAFRDFIEALRHDTAHGLIHGEVIDSYDSYSEKIFFEEALKYCKAVGIEVITKAEAYDICFNNRIEKGNLIYNRSLKNTAKDYFADATNVPTNPDGYLGNCLVIEDIDGNILVTSGETTYIHYGIPLGKIKYTAFIKGNGKVSIYAIKCGDDASLKNLTRLATINIDSKDGFTEQYVSVVVPDNPMTSWIPNLEGRDNKIMGLKIVYSSGLHIKNISLKKE